MRVAHTRRSLHSPSSLPLLLSTPLLLPLHRSAIHRNISQCLRRSNHTRPPCSLTLNPLAISSIPSQRFHTSFIPSSIPLFVCHRTPTTLNVLTTAVPLHRCIHLPASTSTTSSRFTPHAIQQMINSIHTYADMRDPIAIVKIRELLGYDVLSKDEVFAMLEVATKLQADATLYNIPLRLASEAHNLSYARDIVDYMEHTPGVNPSAKTYVLLIAAHKNAPNYADADAVLEKLRSFDAAETEHYTAMIELYGGKGELAKCVELYSEFISLNMKPDTDIMSAMVEACVKNNHIEHALMVATKMKEESLTIPTRVFNAILTLCKGSQSKTAAVLKFMKNSQANPNSDTLDIVQNDVSYQTFMNLWEQIVQTQYPVPTPTMQMVLTRCSREIDLERINSLARDVIKLSYGLRATTPLVNSILAALVGAREKADKVWQMYESLIAIIEEPDKETFEVLISYFALLGDSTRAFRLYESMQKQQLPLTDSVCSALLQSVVRTTEPNQVVAQLVRKGAALGLCPTRAAIEHVVGMVPHDCMQEFMQLMQRRKAAEEVAEREYREEEKRKNAEAMRRQEEEAREREEEQRRKDEEQRKKEEKKLAEQRKKEEKRAEEQRRKEEERKRKEEIKKKEELKRAAEIAKKKEEEAKRKAKKAKSKTK